MAQIVKTGASCGARYATVRANSGTTYTVWIAEDGAVALMLSAFDRLDWDSAAGALAGCAAEPEHLAVLHAAIGALGGPAGRAVQ